MGKICYSYETESDLVVFRVEGQVRMADLEGMAKQQLSETLTRCAIWDLRRGLVVDADLTRMQKLVVGTRVDDPAARRRKVAILVTGSMAAVIGRMYTMATEQMQARSRHRVVTSLDAALAWFAEGPSEDDQAPENSDLTRDCVAIAGKCSSQPTAN